MTIIHLIFDSVEKATEAKETFGDDYQMYCDYLSQFRNTKKGASVRINPISFTKYMAIELESPNDKDSVCR